MISCWVFSLYWYLRSLSQLSIYLNFFEIKRCAWREAIFEIGNRHIFEIRLQIFSSDGHMSSDTVRKCAVPFNNNDDPCKLSRVLFGLTILLRCVPLICRIVRSYYHNDAAHQSRARVGTGDKRDSLYPTNHRYRIAEPLRNIPWDSKRKLVTKEIKGRSCSSIRLYVITLVSPRWWCIDLPSHETIGWR